MSASNVPSELKYTKDHEWARRDGNKLVVGITAFAVDQLGDITLVDLPKVGSTTKSGQAFGSIESVKSVSDLYAPVGGTVTRINDALDGKPELVNDAPYGDGWLVEIDMGGSDADFAQLIDAKAYAALIGTAG